MYRLKSRIFSRVWRRVKAYRESELKRLAKKHGLTTVKRGQSLLVTNPKTSEVIAAFEKIAETNERSDEIGH